LTPGSCVKKVKYKVHLSLPFFFVCVTDLD
jgi:hypothetical protein